MSDSIHLNAAERRIIAYYRSTKQRNPRRPFEFTVRDVGARGYVQIYRVEPVRGDTPLPPLDNGDVNH